MTGQIRIGTSGWSYDHWNDTFYPAGLPQSRWLEHYVSRFPTVEVNMTFYRLPPKTTVRRWHDGAPRGFRFAVKGSRLITHNRRLKNCEREVKTFVERVRDLKSYLGVLLWQLPPDLACDPELLEGFLRMLPRGLRHAVEFRHRSWLTGEVFALLEKYGIACVSVSSTEIPPDRTVTADFVYVRFHGLEGGYGHDYDSSELEPWARFLRAVGEEGRDGFVYFNNDARARAPKNALELTDSLGDVALDWGR